MKLIYDSKGEPGERVYIEKEDGMKHYFPFYKIKVFDGWRVTDLNCYPDSKAQREYFKKHPEKDATPK